MNHAYRVVWNASRGLWQAVSEIAHASAGNGGRSGTSRRARAVAAALLPLGFAIPAWAAGIGAGTLPTGGTVTAGAGSISQNGSTLTVNQTSKHLSLGWQSFNIGSQATVNFTQPNAQSVAVNRIGGNNGSVILGHLNANGQVYLINPNGVLFGRGAQVNVGGLVASTLDVGDTSVETGSPKFSGSGTGSVVNRGTITVAPGGYVALVGNHVVNEGAISAQLGSVALAGGSAVTLSFDSDRLVNVQVDQSTLNNLAKNGELIEANGGHVWMTAGAKDSLLASAVNNTGTIRAQTVQNQNGQITLLAGMGAGTTTVAGTLDASAPGGGNGGFVETSGANVNVADGTKVTTAALLGLSGTWLIDPTDFTISAGGGAQTSSGIGASTLEANLASSNVILATTSTGSQNGDINVDAPVSWSANTLTLDAANNININAVMTASGNSTASAGLALNFGGTAGSAGATPAAGAGLNMAMGGGGFAGQVDFTGPANALSINGHSYTIITSVGAPGSTTGTDLQGMNKNLAGHYALGADINAAATSSWNSGAGFTPVGGGDGITPFSGVFEGLGHTISGLTISYSTVNSPVGVGLLGASSGLIENVGLTGGSIASNGAGAAIGGLVGANYGIVRNAFTTGTVSGSAGGQWIGGLVGCNGCDGEGDTTAQAGAGGHTVTGGTITNAYATGPVSTSSYTSAVGGLVGTNYGSISNAFASGAVSGSYAGTYGGASDNLGGLAGNNWDSITNAYATGNVSFSSATNNNDNFIGGLVGFNSNQTVGTTGTITDTYATGHLSSTDSSDVLGGLVGSVSGGTLTNNYWNTTTSGRTNGAGNVTASGITGLNAVQMETPSSFSGWNINAAGPSAYGSSIWIIYSGETAPLLQSFMTPLTVTAANKTITYSGTQNSGGAGVTYTSYGATVTPTLSGTLSYSGTSQGAQHAGSYAITPGGLYSSQFGYLTTYVSGTLTIAPVELTVVLTNSGVTKTYDGTTGAPTGFVPTYSFTGLLSGDTGATLTSTGAAYNSAHVASADDITVSGLSIAGITGSNGSLASDYMLGTTNASAPATITAAPLTVSLSNTTNVSKTYDGTMAAPGGFAPTYGVAGLVSGDAAAVSSSSTPVFNSAHVASATAITQGGLSLASITGSNGSQVSDYTLTSTTASTGAGVAYITPLTVTATAPTIGGTTSKVYDGTAAASGATLFGGGIVGALSGDTLTLDTSGIMLAYNSSHVSSASSIGASGSVGLDIASSTNGSLASDYTLVQPLISSVAGTIVPATIAPALTNSGVTKSYDGTTNAPTGFTPTYSFTGLVSGDTGATLTDTGAAYNSAHVASANQVTVSGLSISGIAGSNGSQASDYMLASTSASAAATIVPLALTVSAPTIGGTTSKVYDGTTAATGATVSSGSISGMLSGDTLALDTNGITLAYNSSHVSSASSIGASGSLSVDILATGNGSQSTDYSVSIPSIASVPGTITPATLSSILTNSGVTKSYDGTTNAPTGFTPAYSFTGFIAGDTNATLTDTGAAYNSAHVASANQVTVSGLSISGVAGSNGSQAGDYMLASNSASAMATITPAPLTVSLSNTTNVTRAYDGTTAAPAGFSPTYDVTGLVPGDSATLSSASAPTFNASHVASATAIVQGGLSLAAITGINGSQIGDYVLSNTTASTGAGVASIAPATLTAILTNSGVTKSYDGTTNAPTGFTPTYGFTGLVSGDTSATLTDTGAAYNSAHVTSANEVTVSGLNISGIAGSNDSQAGDYTLASTSASAAATITPATLTYVASPASTRVGQRPANLDGTVTGFVGGDTLANATTGTATWTTPATTASAPGNYAIDGSGLVASDYVFTEAAGNATALTIDAAPVPSFAINALAGLQLSVETGGSTSPMDRTDATNATTAAEPLAQADSHPFVPLPGMPADLFPPALNVVSGGVRMP